MHIGRAALVPPEVHQQQARTTLDLTAHDPVVVSSRSVPTGESDSQLPHYNPVTDLIRRHVPDQALDPVPPTADVAAESYAGTPPAPPVLDLRA